jgi:hypothetical protein
MDRIAEKFVKNGIDGGFPHFWSPYALNGFLCLSRFLHEPGDIFNLYLIISALHGVVKHLQADGTSHSHAFCASLLNLICSRQVYVNSWDVIE